MAKARRIPGLTPEQPYAAAAARTVAVQARELSEHAANVLDTEDIERVHDMRVTTRRLRAAMEVFEPCFPRKRFRAALREVKGLADALGERRDRDVAIARLEEFAQRAWSADRMGVDSLIARLRAEQAEANAALASQVTPERLAALRARLGELVEEAEALGGESRRAAAAVGEEARSTP